MQKFTIKFLILLLFTSCGPSEKANADEKFWCIATSELLINFPEFNNPNNSKNYSNDLVENLKIYDKTFKNSIKEISVDKSKQVDIQYGQLSNLLKKEDSDALFLCKIWSDKNNTDFGQINESRVGKDNSK